MKCFLLCLLSILFVGCAESTKLPDGVEIKSVENDVIVFLESDCAIIVRKSGDKSQQMIVSRVGNSLEAMQLELGGNTPRSLKIDENGVGTITVSNRQGEPLRIVFDDDGDGIPEKKIDESGLYELESIEWKQRKRPNKSE